MRLDRLDLTRYGRFTEARVDFPPPATDGPDLHVIFGPNEAGKSTLFSAWLDLLYGIPLRTGYDFLHPGPTMQIGARLTHAGGVLEAVRIKRNGPSLQDANGQALPEAVMQSALSGLGRDGYAAMFSLDDDTLEQGGDSILASRGDLGEMLFAASAGLAGLGPQLDSIRKEIDAFHKPRARNTILKQAKDRLHELDKMRRDLDVSASAAQKLQRDAKAAETAWETARQAETRANAALKQITDALAVLPQQARLARLRDQLAPIAHLPPATEADDRALQAIDHALQELKGRIATRAEALEALQGRKAAVPRDPAILAMADQMAAAAGLHPLHLSALEDLPRRHDRLAEITASQNRKMRALGLTGAAADHMIAPPLMAQLRALVLRRDVAMQALGAAQAEAAKAATRLATAQARQGDVAPADDLQSLSHLITRLRQSDPEARVTRATQDASRANADLAQALLALAPWRGTAEDLQALSPPAPWQIAAWDQTDQATARALRDACDMLDRRRSDLAAAQLKAQTQTAGTPTLADAAKVRQQREAAWASHLAKLTPETARSFETALRLDDQITLQLAEAMAETRRAASAEAELSRLGSALAEAEAKLRACQADRQAFEQTIADCATRLGLAGAGVGDLGPWLGLRQRALTALAARTEAEANLGQAKDMLRDAGTLLAAALAIPADTGFSRLWAEALTRLDTATQRQEAARHLADLQAELTDRKAQLATAEQALADWRLAWHKARTGTALAAVAEDDSGLATLLDDLDHLGQAETERADLANRIAKMQANSHAFQQALASILGALSLPTDTSWTDLLSRQTAAQEAERELARITSDLARDLAAQETDQAKAKAQQSQRKALGDRLGWSGDGSLADHLAACLRASHLRHDIAELEAELAHHPAPQGDTTALEAEATRLQNAQALARTESETRFAELTEAQRALRAIGGDDAVARLAGERANLLNALKEQARTHLAQRFGLMAFEQALHRYRDSHRSAMLSRASDAFRQLSRGAYTGLAAQPQDTSEVLVALPANGGAKLATDLSKGTRFQLYLALRIAGYHELAKSRPPVPFIADDIMETFDDARAEQAFALLAEMSRSGQVIYLTHHQHLCDIALRACPGARLIDLREL
ncbi:ATP-binding protein [Pseudotabrizicola sp. L79]|uniref:ATP-binding protein n=1 Tax=Pseudotabrizicola sp. L79 TaxID=3118402 RepID=UPI002F952700